MQNKKIEEVLPRFELGLPEDLYESKSGVLTTTLQDHFLDGKNELIKECIKKICLRYAFPPRTPQEIIPVATFFHSLPKSGKKEIKKDSLQ